MLSVQDARSSQANRDLFLRELVRDYTPRIDSLLWGGLGKQRNLLPIQSAQQEFLLQANRAIDRAILTDDGRGKNDARRYCGDQGLWAVRLAIRTLKRRIAVEKERHIVLDTAHWLDNDPIASCDQNITDVADVVAGEDIVQRFMLRLNDKEKAVVELLLQGYGHRKGRGDYHKEISQKLGWSIKRLRITLDSLRKKAVYLNGDI